MANDGDDDNDDDDDDKIVRKPFVGPLRKVKFLVHDQAENQSAF